MPFSQMDCRIVLSCVQLMLSFSLPSLSVYSSSVSAIAFSCRWSSADASACCSSTCLDCSMSSMLSLDLTSLVTPSVSSICCWTGLCAAACCTGYGFVWVLCLALSNPDTWGSWICAEVRPLAWSRCWYWTRSLSPFKYIDLRGL